MEPTVKRKPPSERLLPPVLTCAREELDREVIRGSNPNAAKSRTTYGAEQTKDWLVTTAARVAFVLFFLLVAVAFARAI